MSQPLATVPARPLHPRRVVPPASARPVRVATDLMDTMKLKIALFMSIAALIAAVGAPSDGELLSQSACHSAPPRTYDQYVSDFRASYSQELADARAEGFSVGDARDLASALPTRAVFNAMKAYKGFECKRITYRSDGLSVV